MYLFVQCSRQTEHRPDRPDWTHRWSLILTFAALQASRLVELLKNEL